MKIYLFFFLLLNIINAFESALFLWPKSSLKFIILSPFQLAMLLFFKEKLFFTIYRLHNFIILKENKRCYYSILVSYNSHFSNQFKNNNTEINLFFKKSLSQLLILNFLFIFNLFTFFLLLLLIHPLCYFISLFSFICLPIHQKYIYVVLLILLLIFFKACFKKSSYVFPPKIRAFLFIFPFLYKICFIY